MTLQKQKRYRDRHTCVDNASSITCLHPLRHVTGMKAETETQTGDWIGSLLASPSHACAQRNRRLHLVTALYYSVDRTLRVGRTLQLAQRMRHAYMDRVSKSAKQRSSVPTSQQTCMCVRLCVPAHACRYHQASKRYVPKTLVSHSRANAGLIRCVVVPVAIHCAIVSYIKR